mmetsp:Transcript_38580/g.86732  ORF Transcript_38580/g.86732 Transcript_38580/m.86732 type:complete len:247 (+) Transcript_38580:458-1198(+)
MRQRREPTIHHGCSGGRDVVNTECEQSALLAQPIQLVCRPYLALVDHHSGSRAAGDWSLRSSPADQWPLWLRSFSLGARPRHPIAFFERGRPVLRDAGNQRRRWLQRRVAARHAVRPGASSGSSTHKSVDMLRDQGPVLSLVRLVRRLESPAPRASNSSPSSSTSIIPEQSQSTARKASRKASAPIPNNLNLLWTSLIMANSNRFSQAAEKAFPTIPNGIATYNTPDTIMTVVTARPASVSGNRSP